jgi:hypothetical protein
MADGFFGIVFGIPTPFLAGDGYAVTDSGMQQLVQAMASFSPPPAGQTTLPPELAANLAGALAANWQHT